jgi:hypothetical protein
MLSTTRGRAAGDQAASRENQKTQEQSELTVGYTHYFERKNVLDPELFVDAMRDCKSVCQRIGVPLGAWSGKEGEHPLFDAAQILFNGVGDDAHETFCVQRVRGESDVDADPDDLAFDFCKTARKPYDLPVMCCLIILKEYLGDAIMVSSDGDTEDWQPALDKIAEVFGPSFITKPFILEKNRA